MRSASRMLRGAKAAASVAGIVAGSLVLKDGVEASSDHIVPPNYAFSHKGFLGGFIIGAIRRGHQVYVNVCSTCHSMNLLAYRNLVDACYTEEEVKEMCEEIEVEDGPNDEGEMFERPGLWIGGRRPSPDLLPSTRWAGCSG